MVTKKTTQTKVTAKQVPVYKQWWFWLIIILILAGIVSTMKKDQPDTDSGAAESTTQPAAEEAQNDTTIKDYTNNDAKLAFTELNNNGYTVKFVFDRPNQGGFTEESFQKFINESFSSDSYAEMPFVVTQQINKDKEVTLYVEYGSAVESNNAQAAREAGLEERLSIVSAMTACEQYGKRNYRNFKMHSILGKIAEYANDDNTWFLKYYVDYDGYQNRAMECYVTGTTEHPSVSKFIVY